MTHRKHLAILVALALAAGPSAAAVTAEEAAKLGTTLTPMGAEKQGNASGSIPAWEGGLTKPPAGYKDGAPFPDPYATDKPLFTIDASNVEKYKANLSPGQVEM